MLVTFTLTKNDLIEEFEGKISNIKADVKITAELVLLDGTKDFLIKLSYEDPNRDTLII